MLDQHISILSQFSISISHHCCYLSSSSKLKPLNRRFSLLLTPSPKQTSIFLSLNSSVDNMMRNLPLSLILACHSSHRWRRLFSFLSRLLLFPIVCCHCTLIAHDSPAAPIFLSSLSQRRCILLLSQQMSTAVQYHQPKWTIPVRAGATVRLFPSGSHSFSRYKSAPSPLFLGASLPLFVSRIYCFSWLRGSLCHFSGAASRSAPSLLLLSYHRGCARPSPEPTSHHRCCLSVMQDRSRPIVAVSPCSPSLLALPPSQLHIGLWSVPPLPLRFLSYCLSYLLPFKP